MEHPILEPEAEQGKVRGIFEIDDPNFGNLWTNIPYREFEQAGFQYGDRVDMTVCRDGIEVLKETVPFEKSFGYVEKGSTLIYTNELMRIALAVSQGSFCEKYQMGFGPEWTVEFSRID